MDTKKIAEVIDLMAKAGLFFAKVDGQYEGGEKKFIEKYLSTLSEFGDVEDIKGKLEGYLNETFTLEQIIDDTKELVKDFSKVEKAAILASIATFIQKVIKADGDKETAEVAAYAAWKNAVLQ